MCGIASGGDARCADRRLGPRAGGWPAGPASPCRVVQTYSYAKRLQPYDESIDTTQQLAVTRQSANRYEPTPGYFDEAFDAAGNPRPLYATLIGALEPVELTALAGATQEFIDNEGVVFTTQHGTQPFVVDPVPRIIESAEWAMVAAAVAQRVDALNRFVVDIYGERKIIDAGVVPWNAIETAEYYERDLVGTVPPAGIFTNVAGLDLARGEDGVLRVLEDNVRSPSGLTYSFAARKMSEAVLPLAADRDKLPLDGIFDDISAALHAAAPVDNGEPAIALVSDGPGSAAWYEHQAIAKALDIYLFTIDQLENHSGSLYGRDHDGLLKPIDVMYRRTELDRLRSPSGACTHFGELLLDPIRNGTLASVNAFGSGIADDKLIHAYVEEMIRFYLNEVPLIESVRTYDPGDPGTLAMIDDRIGELVIKPRGGLGGDDITIGPRADRAALDAASAALKQQPEAWVAQEVVSLSTHPTVVDGTLEPRHLDLRPYAIHTGDETRTLNACLSRVALTRGALIVNSSQNGGAKDTWIATQ